MTSNINTGSINVNYPTAGINNLSQGFRNNWAGIATNLNTAGAEISDLQNKVLLKAALTGTTLNNDMAGAQISNVLTLGFRATTYDLGSNLSSTVNINLTSGDVQYGTITNNCQLQFGQWSPIGTESRVEVILTVGNPNAVLNLPSNVVYGLNTINNYQGDGVGGNILMPTVESQLHYIFSSIDCGTTITIQPVNLPRQAQQVVSRIVTAQIGEAGDVAGDVCIGSGYGIGSIAINQAGSGYSSPSVVIPPPNVQGGIQAVATATQTAGIITNIVVNTIGSGYLYAPEITITDSGGGLGAVVTPALSNVTNYMYYCSNDYNGSTLIWRKLATQSW
jgi:hypothetical protein